MAAGTTIQLRGAKELERKLVALGRKAGGNIARKGLRAGAKIIQAGVKANAAARLGGSLGGAIARATVVRAQKKKRKGMAGANVLYKSTDELIYYTKGLFVKTTKKGRVRGAALIHRRYFLPVAIEFGHAGPGRGASKEKVSRPIPIMRAAFDDTARIALQKTMKVIWQQIDDFGKGPVEIHVWRGV